ncbi:MAG: polysaccharide biosynthesis C-terminal domain-containing protein [Lachnospiraceae bacterium]|nr:polysaccharide biosynthesis C-terminal domain-containing protein [Lachnospiraceae bacterium]
MDRTVAKTNPLGTERVGKLILTFAVPSIISMVVNALYNIVDQIFIGQGVGYLGNGATNVVMPMTVIAIALSLLIGDGAAAYLSLKLGEGDEKSAANGIGCSISVMAIVGIVLCVLFNLTLEPLCRLFGATEDILPFAMDYGRIISYGILFASIDSGMAGMIRADGSPKYSMAGLLVGCITNIILDPIFIFVFHWGVKGAAWATIAGQILTASTIMLILAFLVFQLAPMSIVRLFGSESELYNEFAVKCFRIFLLACPINGLQMATGIFFQAIGKPTQATVLSLSRQIVYLLPATLLLPLALGVEGALWAGPLADVLAFITTLVMLKLYWKKI